MSEDKKPYCGIGPVPKDQTRGSMLDCAMKKQVKYWGLHTVDKKTLQQALLKTTSKAYLNKLKTVVLNLKYDILGMKKKYKKMTNKTEKEALMKVMVAKNETFKTKQKELIDLETAMGQTIAFKKKKEPKETEPEPEPEPTPTATKKKEPKATTTATKKPTTKPTKKPTTTATKKPTTTATKKPTTKPTTKATTTATKKPTTKATTKPTKKPTTKPTTKATTTATKKPTTKPTTKATTTATKKKEPSLSLRNKKELTKDDKIVSELRNYLIKYNIDATVEELLEKGYLKEYEKYNFVGEAVWEAMKHPCLKIGNNERMFTQPPRLKYYMDKDKYKDLKSKLKTIQQEINGAVYVLGLHPKECHDLPERKQLYEDYQLLFSDPVKKLWKSIYKKLVIPKIMKESKKEAKKEPKSSSKQLSMELKKFIDMLNDDLKKTDNMNKHGNKRTKLYRQFYEDMKNKYMEIIKNEFPTLQELKTFYKDYCAKGYGEKRELDGTICFSQYWSKHKFTDLTGLTFIAEDGKADILDFFHKYNDVGLRVLKLIYFISIIINKGHYVFQRGRIKLDFVFYIALEEIYKPIGELIRDTHIRNTALKREMSTK